MIRNGIKWNKTILREGIRWNNMEWGGKKGIEVQWDGMELKLNGTKWNVIYNNVISWNEMELNKMEWNGMKIELNGME